MLRVAFVGLVEAPSREQSAQRAAVTSAQLSCSIASIQVHPHLWDRLGDMYDNECIFDRLGCAVSPSGQHVAAGAYGELAVFDAATDEFSLLKTCVQPFTQNVRPLL